MTGSGAFATSRWEIAARSGWKWIRNAVGRRQQGDRVFRGVFEHTIDSKGRTSLPARIREVLVAAGHGERLIVTTALDACLHAYPLREWEQLEAGLAKRSVLEPGIKQLMRLYVAGAQECEVDKVGRVLIPPSLRAHAGLEKEVVWAGMVKVVELWSRDGWKAAQEQARAESASIDLTQVLASLRTP